MRQSKWTGSALGILGWSILLAVSMYLLFIPFLFVLPKYLKWYYSHMTIDGKQVEFREDGPYWGLLGWMLLIMITLGLASWYASKKIMQWELSRVHIVDEYGVSTWTGSAWGILGYGILATISMYLFFIPFLFVVVIISKWVTSHWIMDDKQLQFEYEGAYWGLLGWMLLTIITFGLASWYVQKKVTQWAVSHTHFAVAYQEPVSTKIEESDEFAWE